MCVCDCCLPKFGSYCGSWETRCGAPPLKNKNDNTNLYVWDLSFVKNIINDVRRTNESFKYIGQDCCNSYGFMAQLNDGRRVGAYCQCALQHEDYSQWVWPYCEKKNGTDIFTPYLWIGSTNDTFAHCDQFSVSCYYTLAYGAEAYLSSVWRPHNKRLDKAAIMPTCHTWHPVFPSDWWWVTEPAKWTIGPVDGKQQNQKASFVEVSHIISLWVLLLVCIFLGRRRKSKIAEVFEWQNVAKNGVRTEGIAYEEEP